MLEIRHSAGHSTFTTSAAYNQFYQHRRFPIRDSFYLWLLTLMELQPGERFLDVACGNGRMVQLAAQRGFSAAGIDFAQDGIYAGSQAEPRARWLVGDGERLPLDDHSFDCIASIGSLEHYQNPVQGVREIARLLKPHGRVCILLPNAFGLLGNVRHVYRTGEIYDDGQPLQRYATRAAWEAMLHRGGLQVERLVPWGEFNMPRTLPDALWLLQRPQKLIRAFLTWLAPLALANHLIFLCRPLAKTPTTDQYPMLPPDWL